MTPLCTVSEERWGRMPKVLQLCWRRRPCKELLKLIRELYNLDNALKVVKAISYQGRTKKGTKTSCQDIGEALCTHTGGCKDTHGQAIPEEPAQSILGYLSYTGGELRT